MAIVLTLFMVAIVLTRCDESWLEPKPLSFYTPENTYVDAAGFYAAITTCERNMRHEYFGDGSPILTEFILSDMAVEVRPIRQGRNGFGCRVASDENLNSTDRTRVGWYWYEGYKGIEYATL